MVHVAPGMGVQWLKTYAEKDLIGTLQIFRVDQKIMIGLDMVDGIINEVGECRQPFETDVPDLLFLKVSIKFQEFPRNQHVSVGLILQVLLQSDLDLGRD